MVIRSIVFKEELVERLKAMAVENQRSFTGQVNFLLQEALKAQAVDKEPKAKK